MATPFGGKLPPRTRESPHSSSSCASHLRRTVAFIRWGSLALAGIWGQEETPPQKSHWAAFVPSPITQVLLLLLLVALSKGSGAGTDPGAPRSELI